MTDSELKKACIFDLTSDEKILREIIGVFDWKEIPTKEQYLESYPLDSVIFNMLEYSEEFIRDEKLTKRLKRVFKNELELFFNE